VRSNCTLQRVPHRTCWSRARWREVIRALSPLGVIFHRRSSLIPFARMIGDTVYDVAEVRFRVKSHFPITPLRGILA
jgi:hypothetical protein